MKVTHVALNGTAQNALTPEQLAAVMAKYSRTDEGLESILGKVGDDPDVDKIFRFVDYGHQSILDMAPAALFMDGISIFLAYLVFANCPQGSGQETSTRYVKMSADGIADRRAFGIPEKDEAQWKGFIETAFKQYNGALDFWSDYAQKNPGVVKIPDGAKELAKHRILRNYAFDRARYFLPVAALTNVAIVQSARNWMQLTNVLCSHWLPEAKELGDNIIKALSDVFPHLTKHFGFKQSYKHYLVSELWDGIAGTGDAPYRPIMEFDARHDLKAIRAALVFEYHQNRYDYLGHRVSTIPIKFGWERMSFAEIRDMNRHRTGSKWCPLWPRGFYCAEDQFKGEGESSAEFAKAILAPLETVVTGIKPIREALENSEWDALGWLRLGHEFKFEHLTTLDKYIYQMELRTGPGAHFRYAAQCRESVKALRVHAPNIARHIRLGEAEPE